MTKKLIAIIGLCLFSLASFSQQQKKDTIVQITMVWNDWINLYSVINQNIDSKKVTNDILIFLNQRRRDTVIVADKKEPPKK